MNCVFIQAASQTVKLFITVQVADADQKSVNLLLCVSYVCELQTRQITSAVPRGSRPCRRLRLQARLSIMWMSPTQVLIRPPDELFALLFCDGAQSVEGSRRICFASPRRTEWAWRRRPPLAHPSTLTSSSYHKERGISTNDRFSSRGAVIAPRHKISLPPVPLSTANQHESSFITTWTPEI